tara:strand:- start:741 stop:965 length:225 start_codon:yes stop_codon:yes gene_type:complete
MDKGKYANRVWTFTKAIAKYAKSGFENVPRFEYLKRLSTCNECEFREHDVCGVCGCYLEAKAKWNTEDCPKNKW